MSRYKRFVQTRNAPIVNGDTVLTEVNDVEGSQSLSLVLTMLTQGAATGTVQWFLQDSSDGGQTWDDVIGTNTFAFGAALTNQRFYVPLSVAFAGTQGSVVAPFTLTPATTRVGPIGSKLRIVERISAIAGSPTGPQYRIGMAVK